MKGNGTVQRDENSLAIHWFRRDLRLDDNTALNAALATGLPVMCVFIFDPNILRHLKIKNDSRITFIFDTLQKLDADLRARGSMLRIFFDAPLSVYERLFQSFNVRGIWCNEDYEPYARERDAAVAGLCKAKGAEFHAHKDHVVFAPHEVLKDDGKPYNVFTPYSRRWLARFADEPPVYHELASKGKFLPATADHQNPGLRAIGFERSAIAVPPPLFDAALIEHYSDTRDIPSVAGTSRLGVHLRFGTVSIRALAALAARLSQKFLAELIWREFYQMIIWYYPHTTKRPFRAIYEQLKFPGSEADFKAWTRGETGYPLVDAGMRELVATGFMHNRVRMLVASFLTKHLLCDWRWGEHFFAQHLLDFELASNVGGWQWSAGIGVDAAPYFRIFNPSEQQKKFDPKNIYIDRWLKNDNFFGTEARAPIVDHRFARERCLKFFSTVHP
ncbi:cryptochrome/photolyase family protein [Turneriella parva]|uniref:DNA photolyase FAD-binding protein n=1 Tax=Turneriella parva (strain ATCC BAA-1111 / DSM 21527 / NCTC 11395 / H) TaxID=869212 RepID=I4B0W1_TURPD|nr:deoxyribodipyrimidine photo-lyase [Turneriella parva]AFM10918.1 DNA photolyase FAD-binding protein [Turneriella parva DSM 21527]